MIKMYFALLLFLTLGAGLSQVAVQETRGAQEFCDAGWTQYKKACYKRFDSPELWTDAEIICLSHDSHLASIHHSEENEFVYNFMGRPNDPLTRRAYWIGMYDRFKEGTYMYTDGSKITFTQFGAGQPDNNGDEDVVGSWYFVKGCITWNDYKQPAYKFPFVCKYYLGNRLCMREEASYAG